MPGLRLIFGLSIVGTAGWVVAQIAAAIALRRAGMSRGPFILLILAGVLLMGGHPFPWGTLAFGYSHRADSLQQANLSACVELRHCAQPRQKDQPLAW